MLVLMKTQSSELGCPMNSEVNADWGQYLFIFNMLQRCNQELLVLHDISHYTKETLYVKYIFYCVTLFYFYPSNIDLV